MQSSNPDAFDEFQVEFLEYLERRLGVEREVVTAMLSHWLVHHSHRGGPGPKKTVPEQEPASSEAGAPSAAWPSRRR